MNDKKADLGMDMLLNENATHSLEIEYNHDMEQVFIQLRSKKDGKCIVLDADSIFEQAYDVLSKKENDVATQYVIRMDGVEFSGTPEDIARWYCKQRGIKLFIEPETENPEDSLVLYALFSDADTLTLIAYLEGREKDIETAYRLFFSEYMREIENPDFTLSDV